MTDSIIIRARIDPYGKPSVRTRKAGGTRFKRGKTYSYWPQEYTNWCEEFDGIVRLAKLAQGFGEPLDGPLQVHIIAAKKPTAIMRSNRARGKSVDRYRTVKPDGDNVQKAVYDALTRNGVIKDDRFLCLTSTESIWSEHDRGYIIVSVSKIQRSK